MSECAAASLVRGLRFIHQLYLFTAVLVASEGRCALDVNDRDQWRNDRDMSVLRWLYAGDCLIELTCLPQQARLRFKFDR